MLHQCLHFDVQETLDHFGLEYFCGAGSGSCCCDKNQVSDGIDHEHRKLLIGRPAIMI